MDRFFDAYPRFFETSTTSAWPERLNLRWHAIIGRHADALRGRRVLDVASHDGRWSFAALKAGAEHVTAVEPRPELVAAARENLATYGIAPDRCRLVQDDIFAFLQREAPKVDVILCLGFFYHTMRHVELLDLFRATGATLLIVDSHLWMAPGVAIDIRLETIGYQAHAVADGAVLDDQAMVGYPTLDAVTLMMRHHGYRTETVDWAPLLADHAATPAARENGETGETVSDYARGERATVVGWR